MLTFAAALAATINLGTLVMLPGTYVGTKFDMTRAKTVTVRAQGTVNVMLGEKKNVFTLHSGTTWKTTISTVIPQDRLFYSVNDFRAYVFEWGTPEGLITAPLPLQQGRTYRLDHYRLTWGGSKDTLTAGQFWYDSGTSTLYLCRTDSSDPNGHDYWIPSQTASNSFVSGGTAATNITISGVRVFFGKDNFDFSGVASYTLTNALAFGAGNEGVVLSYGTAAGTVGTEMTCEYAANANDGTGRSAAAGVPIYATITNGWMHDNGDEGATEHNTGCSASYIGGLYENNASSGATWASGSVVTFTNPRTRENDVYGLCATISTTGGSITGWLSERDYIAAGATSNSTLNVSGSTIILSAAVGALALNAGSAGDTVNFLTHVGGVTTPRGGGGVFNVT